MQPLPLVGAEVHRVSSVFGLVAGELSGAGKVVSQVDVRAVGTRACDDAVSQAVADLRTALAGLEAVAEQCVQVMARHGVFADPTAEQPPVAESSP